MNKYEIKKNRFRKSRAVFLLEKLFGIEIDKIEKVGYYINNK